MEERAWGRQHGDYGTGFQVPEQEGASCLASGGIPAGSGGGEAALESGSLKLIICLENGGGKKKVRHGNWL